MSEWWTYTPADFLMFAPRTYWRLFELHNQALWPLHVAALLAGLAVAALAWRGGMRPAAWLLAVAWAWVAWSFLLQRYATIHTAAPSVAVAFAVQAAALALLAPKAARRSRAGLALIALGLAYPLLALATGRPWSQAEVFAIAPDPTAIATLGVALHATGGRRWALLAIPAVWCLLTGVTLWAMAAPEAPVAPAAAVVALLAAARGPPRDQ